MVRKLFPETVMKASNVRGVMGKQQLNPEVMQYVKSMAFQSFPLKEKENKSSAWQGCIRAIDEACRRLNKGHH